MVLFHLQGSDNYSKDLQNVLQSADHRSCSQDRGFLKSPMPARRSSANASPSPSTHSNHSSHSTQSMNAALLMGSQANGSPQSNNIGPLSFTNPASSSARYNMSKSTIGTGGAKTERVWKFNEQLLYDGTVIIVRLGGQNNIFVFAEGVTFIL